MIRRKPGRHARSIRRFTPRRWLPFVALMALIATAVIISEQVGPTDTDEVVVSSPESLLPVAAVPDPVSSTWFCSGGTAVEAGQQADLSVVVSNAHEAGATALVTFFGTDGEPESERIDVPANGRVRVRARDVRPGDWSAATIEVFGGQPTVERRIDGDDGFDQSPCSSSASDTWYLPSGSTLRGAAEHIFLFNPFPDATSVDIRFATDEGAIAPQALRGVAVPPRSLRVVTVENPARRREVAATVTTRTGRIVVDRLQTFDGSGDPVTGTGATPLETEAPRGIASSPGLATPSPRWIFPDARIAFGSRTQLAVMNPNDEAVDLDLVVSFEDPDLYDEIDPIRITLRAGQQTVFDLTDDPNFQGGMELMLDLRSVDGVPFVAELLWHTGERDTQEAASEPDPDAEEDLHEHAESGEEESPDGGDDEESDEGSGEGESSEEGSEDDATGDAEEEPEAVEIYAPGFALTAGSPVGARSWFVAGRGADAAITSEVVVANPSAAPVEVDVTELVGGSRKDLAAATVTVPGGGRVTLDLSGAEPGSPLIISGDGPLVVGRTMWATTGRGTSIDLATPFPHRVVPLPTV